VTLSSPAARHARGGAGLRRSLALAGEGEHNLFAYPAQSNFSSVQHPLEWIALAHAHGWDVLLDAAAYAPTSRLDLSRWGADFVPLSFYKIFGYPTGLGALIAKKTALAKLHRPWFAGGTITVASVQGDKYYLADGHTASKRARSTTSTSLPSRSGCHIRSIGLDLIQAGALSQRLAAG
jgi:selenocysteine lyase/cysteine desulfurase